jgi:hypothetical protein
MHKTEGPKMEQNNNQEEISEEGVSKSDQKDARSSEILNSAEPPSEN